MTDAAVIIPHYDDPVRLSRCLEALMPQIAGAPGATEVVVVDNTSPTPPKLGHEGARLVIEPRKGAALARNRGVAETTAPRLFFLDCDCVPAQDWLASAYASADMADLVGGDIAVFHETPPPLSGPEVFEAVFAFDNRGYVERKGFSVTANLLTRRAVFDRVGGFAAGLSEDLDWCRRATEAGYAIAHAPRLRVSHPSRADWPALRRKWRRLTDEAWGLRTKGIAGRAGWALRALAMPASALVHAPRILRHRGLTPTERLAGLATLLRLRLTRSAWMLSQAVSGGTSP